VQARPAAAALALAAAVRLLEELGRAAE